MTTGRTAWGERGAADAGRLVVCHRRKIMGKRKTYKLTALGAAVALAATLSIQSSATASTRRTQDAPVLTDAQIAAMPPTAQAL